MNRLLFEKTGIAVYLSHLDTMRQFQRCFLRAGLRLKHTEGFNRHAIVSIALPLSVGTSSQCEILDFTLEGEPVTPEELVERLNRAFPTGIRAIEAYDSARKIKELTHLQAQVQMEYDNGIPDGTEAALTAFFAQPEILVEKKSKKGLVEADIKPMIQAVTPVRLSDTVLRLDCTVCAQNPSLNPDLLAAAVTRHLPDFAPDFYKTHRVEVLDADGNVFR
jgi:radical SAM-linked protein